MEILLKKQYLIPLIYLILVVICILLAFDYKGSLNWGWWLILCGLTVPWSFVSVIFMWALMHGAGLEFFTVMYLFFALINSWFFYFIAKPESRRID